MQSTCSKVSTDSVSDDNKKRILRHLMEFKRYMMKDSSSSPICEYFKIYFKVPRLLFTKGNPNISVLIQALKVIL